MRIAVFCGRFPAFSETFIIEEVCQLMDKGNEVFIFSSERGSSDFTNEKFEQYKLSERTIYLTSNSSNYIRRIFKKPFFRLLNLRRTLNLLKRVGIRKLINNTSLYLSFCDNHDFDIIHGHFAIMGNLAVDLRENNIISGKIVTTFHGSGLVTLNSNKGIYPELIEKGDLFIANSSFTSKVAISKGYPKDKIVYIPAHFDSEKFQRKKTRNYPKDKVIVLSIGRLIPFKGFVYGIKAINRLIEEGWTNIEYRIIGEGPMRAEIENEIIRCNLQKHVTLLGQQTSEFVKEELENADVYIMPGIIDNEGRAEAQGVVLQEAQAMQLPVIASRVGGMVQGIKDGETGFLVTQKDSNELADKIKWFLKNQDKINEFGHKGRAFVLEHFNSKKSIEKLLECYKVILSK